MHTGLTEAGISGVARIHQPWRVFLILLWVRDVSQDDFESIVFPLLCKPDYGFSKGNFNSQSFVSHPRVNHRHTEVCVLLLCQWG